MPPVGGMQNSAAGQLDTSVGVFYAEAELTDGFTVFVAQIKIGLSPTLARSFFVS